MPDIPLPYLISINLTRACNLACPHCYLDAAQRGYLEEDALRLAELSALFRDLGKKAPETIIVLTGGEPVLHPQLEAIITEGAGKNLKMVLGSNGMLLTREKLSELKKAGLAGVSLSLDAINSAQHDRFRGVAGAFKAVCRAFEACRELEIHSQVNFTILKENYHQIGEAAALSKKLGASVLNFFFLVCVGRGESSWDLSPALYEECLNRIAALQAETKDLMIQSRCSPHFKRMLYEKDPKSPYTRATGYDGGGCLAATRYCRIDYRGNVTPCPYMALSAGNIRETGFWKIWEGAVLFRSLRNPELLKGKCGHCEFKLLCGGCRARALAQTGNLMGPDPNCVYKPGGGDVIPHYSPRGGTEATWTPEAVKRLKKVPLFVRWRVKAKLEERAVREGTPVTPELMTRHKKERERELGIRFS